MAQMVNFDTKIVGAREVLSELKQVDKTLERQTRKQMRNAVRPLQDAAKRNLPGSPPMSGWTRGRYGYNAGSARSGIRVRTGGRAKRSDRIWPLVEMRQSNAAGIIFDMAGRKSSGSSPQGRQFIRNLNRRHGRASRSMWPAAEDNLDTVRKEIERAVDDAAKAVNRRIKTTRRF